MPETTRSQRVAGVSALVVSQLILCPCMSAAFHSRSIPHSMPSSPLYAAASPEDDITKQLERAKSLLEKSKAKIEAQGAAVADFDEEEAGKTDGNIPFFANAMAKANGSKRDQVIKAKNGEGLFTTDGDLMAKLSEAEEWEVRALLDVFENENKDLDDSLADRDVAASIFGLQKTLQTEDFQKIFDKRNRFIGEQ